MPKLKIAVVKCFTAKDVFGENIPEYFGKNLGPCSKHKVGQEFILDGTDCPEGFCNWAYADFQKALVRYYLLANDSKGTRARMRAQYLACTDGMHPVVFRLEWLSDR